MAWHYIRCLIRLGKHPEQFNVVFSRCHRGIRLKQSSTNLESLMALIKSKWLLRRISPKQIEVAMMKQSGRVEQILAQLVAPSFMVNKHLMVPIIYHLLQRMIITGHSHVSGFSMACWGLVCIITGKKQMALEWGEVGLSQAKQLSSPVMLARTAFVMGHFIRPWSNALTHSISDLQVALNASMQTNQWVFAIFSKLSLVTMYFFSGCNLTTITSKMLDLNQNSLQTSITDFSKFDDITIGLLHQLKSVGATSDQFKLSNIHHQQIAVQIWYYLAQLINACINNEYDSALNWNRELSAIIDECIGTQFYIQYIFWSTFLFKQCIMNKKKMPWLTSRRIKRHMSMLTQCAKECPENYAAMVALLSAINEEKNN